MNTLGLPSQRCKTKGPLAILAILRCIKKHTGCFGYEEAKAPEEDGIIHYRRLEVKQEIKPKPNHKVAQTGESRQYPYPAAFPNKGDSSVSLWEPFVLREELSVQS